MWFFCILILFALLLHSYIDFRHIMMERQITKDVHQSDSAKEKQKKETNEINLKEKSPVDDNSRIVLNTLQQSKVETGTLDRSGRFNGRVNSTSLFSESLRDHIVFIVLVTGIFIIGTAPTAIVYFISATNPYVLEGLSMEFVFLFLILFRSLSILINSILLCSAYSGLNIALKSLVRSIVQCHYFKYRQ